MNLDETVPLQVASTAETNPSGEETPTVKAGDIETPKANVDLGNNMHVWWSWLPLSGVIAGIIDKIYTKIKDRKKDKEEDEDQDKESEEDKDVELDPKEGKEDKDENEKADQNDGKKDDSFDR